MGHTQLTRVDETNLEQAKAWDGDEGTTGPGTPSASTPRSPRTTPTSSTRCGSGPPTRCSTSAAAPARPPATPPAARSRASPSGWTCRRGCSTSPAASPRPRVPNAHFLRADAQVHPFEPAAFDVAISRTGAMFFGDQAAAFANIARALRPGGQLALLVWQGRAQRLDARLRHRDGRRANLSPPGRRPGTVRAERPGPGARRPHRGRLHRAALRGPHRTHVVRPGRGRRHRLHRRAAGVDGRGPRRGRPGPRARRPQRDHGAAQHPARRGARLGDVAGHRRTPG